MKFPTRWETALPKVFVVASLTFARRGEDNKFERVSKDNNNIGPSYILSVVAGSFHGWRKKPPVTLRQDNDGPYAGVVSGKIVDSDVPVVLTLTILEG